MGRLEDVNWGELEHAYGSGADVPEGLKALWTDRAAEIVEGLGFGSLCHQDTVYTASTAAIPFLIERLCQPPPVRLLPSLLVAMAGSFGEPTTRPAILEAIPQLLAAFRSGGKLTKIGVAVVLAALPEAKAEGLPAMQEAARERGLIWLRLAAALTLRAWDEPAPDLRKAARTAAQRLGDRHGEVMVQQLEGAARLDADPERAGSDLEQCVALLYGKEPTKPPLEVLEAPTRESLELPSVLGEPDDEIALHTPASLPEDAFISAILPLRDRWLLRFCSAKHFEQNALYPYGTHAAWFDAASGSLDEPFATHPKHGIWPLSDGALVLGNDRELVLLDANGRVELRHRLNLVEEQDRASVPRSILSLAEINGARRFALLFGYHYSGGSGRHALALLDRDARTVHAIPTDSRSRGGLSCIDGHLLVGGEHRSFVYSAAGQLLRTIKNSAISFVRGDGGVWLQSFDEIALVTLTGTTLRRVGRRWEGQRGFYSLDDRVVEAFTAHGRTNQDNSIEVRDSANSKRLLRIVVEPKTEQERPFSGNLGHVAFTHYRGAPTALLTRHGRSTLIVDLDARRVVGTLTPAGFGPYQPPVNALPSK